MSISSSLAAGVSGLNAHAQQLSTISDNISNSSTFGYKRVVADFHSMVISESGGGKYTAGGVRTTTQRLIDESGQLQATQNSTDISIKGRGFLPVTQLSAVGQGGGTPLSLKTTGSFRPNNDGVLVDPSGYTLLGWPANANDQFPPSPRDSAAGLSPVNVRHNQYATNPTTQMGISLNLPASASAAGANGTPEILSLQYFGNLGQNEAMEVSFMPTVPADGASNEWRMVIRDGASNDAVIGDFTLTFNDDAALGGTLASVVSNVGNYNEATGVLTVETAGGEIDIDIGMLNTQGGITQLEGIFAPESLTKNGSNVGNLVGVEIDKGGIVYGIYESGFTRPIFKVPLVDVPNANGLISGDAQTYRVSRESGPMFLWDAGTGPTGETVGFSREASTTDVAAELTQLIQTQRAYSSNAKVIQTVDEMLQETTNLKR